MNAQRLGSSISGDSEVAGALRSRLPRLPMRSLFPTTLQNPELLTPSASDCAARRPLTKSEEEETIIINRPGRSTYPDEKSVLTSGATPDLRTAWQYCRGAALDCRSAAMRTVQTRCRSLRKSIDF